MSHARDSHRRAFRLLFVCLASIGIGQSMLFAILLPAARTIGISPFPSVTGVDSAAAVALLSLAMVRFGRLLAAALLIAAIVWTARRIGIADHLSVDGVRTLVERYAPYGPLVFVGLCMATIFLHLPEIVIIAIGGILFNTVEAFAYGWIGCLLGASGTFLLVRYATGDAFQRGVTDRFPRLRALDQRLARNGFLTVLLLRVVLFAAPPLNWGLGATRVTFPQYFAGTALGIVPAIGAAVFFGETFVGAESEDGAQSRVIVAAVLVGFIALMAVVGRRLLPADDRAKDPDHPGAASAP